MQNHQIGSQEAGQRLDKFLHKYFPEAGTAFLYKMLRKKNIVLNKKKAEGKEILVEGDSLDFFFRRKPLLNSGAWKRAAQQAVC